MIKQFSIGDPLFGLLAVSKDSIENFDVFKRLLKLFQLDIYNEEPSFYIVSGNEDDLIDFYEFWN